MPCFVVRTIKGTILFRTLSQDGFLLRPSVKQFRKFLPVFWQLLQTAELVSEICELFMQTVHFPLQLFVLLGFDVQFVTETIVLSYDVVEIILVG